MKVEIIAECTLGAYCNTFDLHSAKISPESQCLVFFWSGRLRQVLMYISMYTILPVDSFSNFLLGLIKLGSKTVRNYLAVRRFGITWHLDS